MPHLKAQYLLPSCITNLSYELWQDIKSEYDTLFPQPSIIDVELEGWKHAVESGAVQAESLQEAVFAAQFMFPNIHTILKVLLTMPVSTASAERSFSGLRRLKTYLRSNMLETHLSNLVWLCSTSITIITLISQKLFVNLILVVEELLFFILQNHIAKSIRVQLTPGSCA